MALDLSQVLMELRVLDAELRVFDTELGDVCFVTELGDGYFVTELVNGCFFMVHGRHRRTSSAIGAT